MKKGLIEMSQREIHRLEVMEQLKNKGLRQREAAKQLGISIRQVKRLYSRYKQYGAAGLISKARGRPGNHRLDGAIKARAMALIREHYWDFGPTLAHEYLSEGHGLELSVETLRQEMIKAGLWNSRRRRKTRVHQQRERRSKFGEMVQLDGSPHDWFEGRNKKCCLLVLIDDATSAILGAEFHAAETRFGYFSVTEKYLKEYGKPASFYSDKHGIFRVNIKEAKSGTGETQFSRACQQLNIELIHAHSPQAKGRVERANGILQDRLVKAMRLAGISSLEQANAFLPGFIDDYNHRFAKPPKCEANAHRELELNDDALAHILSEHTTRQLSKNLECRYNNVIYQIQAQHRKNRLQYKRVLVVEDAQKNVTIFYQDKPLEYKVFEGNAKPKRAEDAKTVNAAVDRLTKKPVKQKRKIDTPWRNFVINPKKHHLRQLKNQRQPTTASE